jgi:hypothetical protein
LSGIVGRVDVNQIHLAYSLRGIRRVHQVRLGGLRSFDRLLWNYIEGSFRVRLPPLHVRRINAGGVCHSVSTFNDRGEQQVIVVCADLPRFAPTFQLLARRVDSSGILRSEVHPARPGIAGRGRKVSSDEPLARRKTRELARLLLQISSGALRDDIRALKHIRRH